MTPAQKAKHTLAALQALYRVNPIPGGGKHGPGGRGPRHRKPKGGAR